MKRKRIRDLASIVRSKNAGPFELTFDVFFRTEAIYRRAKAERIVDGALVRRLYGVSEEETSIVYFDPARAVKITIPRRAASGSAEDTDVYGAQQHVPLADAEVPWED